MLYNQLHCYASAGILGVAIVSLLLGMVLRAFDKIASNRDPVIAGATLGMACYSLTNGYFHSSLLTGGLIFGAALMLALPPPRELPFKGGGPSRCSGHLKWPADSGQAPAFEHPRRPPPPVTSG